MGLQNSQIIISKNIKLDKSYKDVLDYTEAEMVALCRANAVATDTSYSFIRSEKGVIKTSFSYNDALKCNYMAFQNPDYSNKWFFAFIDDVEYANDGTAKIYYTIDEYSTWFDYWNPEACLVIREHVNNDTVGLHTYPEGLEHGDYIVNSYNEYGNFTVEQSFVVIATTWLPSNTPGITATSYQGGVVSGCYFMAFYTPADATKFIKALDGLGRGDAVVSVFMIPSFLAIVGTWHEADLTSKENLMNGKTQDVVYHIKFALLPNTTGSVNYSSDYTVTLNSAINGYTPKNKKLLCYPYNYVLLTNNNGNNCDFHYEDFINNTPVFSITGVLSPGCSIKCFPKNYKLYTDQEATEHAGFNDGLMAGKFPIGSYKNDSFVNWMTQQSVNTKFAQVGSAFKIGGMLFQETGGDDSQYASLFNQQAKYLSDRYQHALVSPQASGNINGGDVTFAFNEMNFGIYQMSIREEYARILDEYFEKFGYMTNRVKLPNQTGRLYWNFVQIGSSENIGYSSNVERSVPATSMDTINGIYRSGVTIWHDHANIGNYSLNNTIA